MVHTMGINEEHEDEDKLKITVFNVDKAGQDTQEVTTKPDKHELNTQDLNTRDNHR